MLIVIQWDVIGASISAQRPPIKVVLACSKQKCTEPVSLTSWVHKEVNFESGYPLWKLRMAFVMTNEAQTAKSDP